MGDANELPGLMQAAIENVTRYHVVVEGTIQAVDADPTNPDSTFTATVNVNGTPHYNVPLKILIGSQAAVLAVPVVGTDCLMGFRDGTLGRPQIIDVDQVATWLITCGTVVYNGGKLGGMVKLLDLVSRLNLIENAFNAHITEYNTHTHISGAQGAPTGNPIIPSEQDLTPTERTDIENTKITQ